MAKTWAEKLVEIATLRERIVHLTDGILELRAECDKLIEALAAERARSDSAVDKLLGAHGMPPVTPAVVPTLDQLSSLFEEDPTEVREIQQDIKERGAANVLLGID